MSTNDSNQPRDSLPSLSLSKDEIRADQYARDEKSITTRSVLYGWIKKFFSTWGMRLSLLGLFSFVIIVVGHIVVLRRTVHMQQIQLTQMVEQMDKMVLFFKEDHPASSKTIKTLDESVQQLLLQHKHLEKKEANQSKTLSMFKKVVDTNKKSIANLRWRNKLDAGERKKMVVDFAALEEQLKKTQSSIKALSINNHRDADQQKINVLKNEIEKQEKISNVLKNEIEKQEKISNVLKIRLTKDHEHLQSLDSYRVQTNQRLLQIENTLRKHNE